MKRVLAIAAVFVLAASVLAWGDVDIFFYGSGSGEVYITEHLYTSVGEIHEYFYAEGYWEFMKDVFVWEGPDVEGFYEYKYFMVDGFVDFHESTWLVAPPWDPDYFEVGAFAGVYGDGFVIFEKYTDVFFDSDWWEGDLYQEVFVEGYMLWGDVYTGHTGFSDSYYYVDQMFEFNVWTPGMSDHIYQGGFILPGEDFMVHVDVFLNMEPFQISSFIDDYVW